MSELVTRLRTLISESEMRDATISDVDEALVRKRECPKCGDILERLHDGGGLSFWNSIGCGCVFITEAEGRTP